VLHAGGWTDDVVTTPGFAREMRYHDPRVDDFVPPEPFEEAVS
jgi:hypothetical protein